MPAVLARPAGACLLRSGQPHPGPAPQPLYLNSFSLFPRRSRTSQWELKASCGGMPQRMMAFRKAFRCRALKPSTWAGQGVKWAENSGMEERTVRGHGGSWGSTQKVEPRPTSTWPVTPGAPQPSRLPPDPTPSRGSCSERREKITWGKGSWEQGSAAGPHLNVATNAGEKRGQGLVPVALQLPPGLSPTTWGAVPPRLSVGPRAS